MRIEESAIRFIYLTDLCEDLLEQYRAAINDAFPPITQHSQVIKKYWDRLEIYFPDHQIFMVEDDQTLLGFINTIPFFWDNALEDLPDDGWDWMMKKGIVDFQNDITVNCLGGLQVIIPKEHQGKGYSKQIIAIAKTFVKNKEYDYLIIPIRPTFKSKFPEIKMEEYCQKKVGDKIYDPWIRTHLNSGAEIIKVCPNSMQVEGSLTFWEGILGEKITGSGNYIAEGALNPVEIEVEKDYGVYHEENIWIYYG